MKKIGATSTNDGAHTTHPFAPGRLTLSVAALVEPWDPLTDVVVDPLAPRVLLRRTVQSRLVNRVVHAFLHIDQSAARRL